MREKAEGCRGGRSRFWAAKWRDEPEKKPEANREWRTSAVWLAVKRGTAEGLWFGACKCLTASLKRLLLRELIVVVVVDDQVQEQEERVEQRTDCDEERSLGPLQ